MPIASDLLGGGGVSLNAAMAQYLFVNKFVHLFGHIGADALYDLLGFLGSSRKTEYKARYAHLSPHLHLACVPIQSYREAA